VSRDKIKEALARLPENFVKDVYASGRYSVAGVPPLPDAPKDVPPLTAGDVLATYDATFHSPNGLPYGALYDNLLGDFYVSNLGSGFPGDNKDYRFLADGTQTGETIDMSSLGYLPVDGTFNGRTGMFWQATNDFFEGTNTCVYEIDPGTKALTGNTICPALPTRQTGLAYDVISDTYYSGSFFDGVINHFDGSGTILDSASVGLNISGLAYNITTGHLFVFNQDVGSGATDDVYVLDVHNNYAVVGSFFVGPPGINFAAAGGAEIDCDGHLILIDQLGARPILVVDSGETTLCPFASKIPWVSEDPTDGTVPGVAGTSPTGGGNVFPVTVSFDSTSLLPGLRQAQLRIGTDTPHSVAPVPLNFTVRFLDVPDNNLFQAYIYGAAGAGVMFGGTPGCSDSLHFCPNGVVTRADMAGYLFRAIHGANTPPPVYQNTFEDVSYNDYNALYIQGIYDDGITAGCNSSPPLYCPNAPMTRAQMAVLVYKGEHGSTQPPACTTQIFNDVPCDAFAADYIKALYNEGVTAGCGGGNFCPHGLVTNGQMAVFLVKSFNIPYLP
jgi:S-layer homology domain